MRVLIAVGLVIGYGGLIWAIVHGGSKRAPVTRGDRQHRVDQWLTQVEDSDLWRGVGNAVGDLMTGHKEQGS